MKSVWAQRLVAVAAMTTCLAAGTLPAEAKDLGKVKGLMGTTGVAPEASALLIAKFKPERSQLKIKAKGLTPGADYTILAGGVTVANLQANSSGKISQRFQTPAKGRSLPLDFDPRGQTVALNDGTSDILQMVVSSTGEPAGTKVDERTNLTPTALAPGGKAEARFRLKKDGRTTFKVEIEDIANGDYDLFVDGIFRAVISVAAGEGEVEFDSEASPPKLPLDFDPRGAIVDVSSGWGCLLLGRDARPGERRVPMSSSPRPRPS